MLKIKSLVAISLFSLSLNAMAENDKQPVDMNPPKPVENKVYDAMVGTWKAKASDMMGKKMNQEFKARWALNHQFLVMDVKATEVGNPKSSYEGMGIFGVDSQGKAKTSWFDSWGTQAVKTGTGDFGENTLTITDAHDNYKETRSFEIKGNEMIMRAKGSMTVDGSEKPFDVTTVYKKR